MDFSRTQNHHIFGKYSAMTALVNCDFGLGAAGGPGLCNGGPGTAPTLVQVATIGQNIILSPNMVLDQVLGFNRMSQHGTDAFYGQNIGLDLGIPGTNGPDIRQSGFPIINISGFTSLGQTANWMPFWRADQSWTTSHNLTWTHGSHEVRAGFDMIRYQLNQWQPEAASYGPRGWLSFDGAVTALNGGRVAQPIQRLGRIPARPRPAGRQEHSEHQDDGTRMAIRLVRAGSLAGQPQPDAQPRLALRAVPDRAAHSHRSRPL